MAQRFDIGAYGAVWIGGRDITRHTKRFSSTQNIAAVDETGLQPPGGAMTYIAGLEGDAISLAGMLPVNRQKAQAEMQKALGLYRDWETILLAPWNATPGRYAEMLRAEQTRFGTDFVTGNITGFSSDYIGTAGIKRGTCLHSSQLYNGAAANQIAALTLENVSPDLPISLKVGVQTFILRLVDYANDAAIRAGIKAGLEAFYPGRTITITGSLTGTTYKSGGFVLEWDGAVSVPTVNVVSETTGFRLSGASDASFNGGYFPTNGITTNGAPVLQHGTNANARYLFLTQFAEGGGALYWAVDDNYGDSMSAGFNYMLTGVQGANGNVPVVGVYTGQGNSAGNNAAMEAIPTMRVALNAVQDGGKRETPLNMISAAFNGTDIVGPTTDDGGYALIVVPYASPDCSATVRIQHADDDGNGNPGSFSTLVAFDVITKAGFQWIDIPRGTPIKAHRRIAISPGQITGKLAFVAALALNSPTSQTALSY